MDTDRTYLTLAFDMYDKIIYMIYFGLQKLFNLYSFLIRLRYQSNLINSDLTLENEFDFPFWLISHCQSICVLSAIIIIFIIWCLTTIHWIIQWIIICFFSAILMNWIVKILHNRNNISDNAIEFAIQGDYIFGYPGLLHYLPMFILRFVFTILPFQQWHNFQQNVTNSVNTTAHLLYSNACIHNIQRFVYFIHLLYYFCF